MISTNFGRLTLLSLILVVRKVSPHARLLEPPSRASMWRMGFDSPENFDDDQTYCGGWGVQWTDNGGRCGVCGDPWSALPRQHEAPGGKFATGQIVRRYSAGSWIPVIVDITTNHGGFFIFKLCHNDDVTRDPGQECFESNILQTGKDGETELRVGEELWGPVRMYVKLPDHVTCDQCIIQWTWIAANNWGSCHHGGRGMGCGPQETFRSCADIAISGKVPNTGPKKMEKLKKLYLLLKKREKEKSSLLTRLKLLKIKREMALKMNEIEQRDQRGLRLSKKEVEGKSRRNMRLTTQKNMKTEQKMFEDYGFEETKSYSGDKKTLSGLVLPWWMRIMVKIESC